MIIIHLAIRKVKIAHLFPLAGRRVVRSTPQIHILFRNNKVIKDSKNYGSTTSILEYVEELHMPARRNDIRRTMNVQGIVENSQTEEW